MGMTTKEYHIEVTPSDFKDTTGRWRTKSLFLETNDNEKKYGSIFTLRDEDTDGRISMRRIYLEANDPTEYLAAKNLFGSVDCWNNLCKTQWFKPHLARWRGELHSRIKSRAIHRIEEAAHGPTDVTAQQLNAAKWLATQEFDGNKLVKQKGPGRPPKLKDPELRLKEALDDSTEENEDFARLFED